VWYKFVKAQKDKKQPSLFFDSWAEGNEIKDGNGNPIPLYHGTVSPFNQFDPSLSNIDNHIGQGIYTSTSPTDVGLNYANLEGPDLVNRIQHAREKLEQDLEYGDIDGFENATEEEKQAYIDSIIQKMFHVGNPRTLALYGKMKNPAKLIKDDSNIYKNGVRYDDDLDDWIDEEGEAEIVFREIENVAYDYDLSYEQIQHGIAELQEALYNDDGFTAYELNKALRKNSFFSYVEDLNGNLAISEFIRKVFENLGHDGIIIDAYDAFTYKDPYGRIYSMPGIKPGDKHYIFFDPRQLKSKTGNSGVYDSNSPILTD
jgi:hypothetical protein